MRPSFKQVIDRPFLGIEHVHPLQQRKVRELVDHFSENPDIKRVILFGSSVEENCNIDSDIDIYIESACYDNLLKKAFHFPIDRITPDMLSESLRKEIKRHGVVIYERRDISSDEGQSDESI